MKKVIQWASILLVLAIILGGIWWWQRETEAGAESQAAEMLRRAEVARGDLEITVPTSGNVVAQRSADLHFDAPGIVAQIPVEVGDRVAEGETLAQLETAALERAVAQAELALEEAQLQVRILKKPPAEEDIQLAELAVQEAGQSLKVARLSQTSAELQGANSVELAQDALENVREAYETTVDQLQEAGMPLAYGAGATAAYMEAEGNVGVTQVQSEYQVQQAESQWFAAYQTYQQAVNNLADLKAGPDEIEISRTELQVEQAEVQLDRARSNLAAATLTAPFDGVISAVNMKEDAMAPTQMPAVTLLDDREFYVDVTVDEIEIGKAAVGQTAEVTLDAYPNTPITGTITRISALPNAPTGLIAYPVRIRLDDPAGVAIRAGMTANAIVQSRRLEDVLLAPNWAVRTGQREGAPYIYSYYLQNGQPVQTEVVIGASNENYTQILDGLEAGQTVALVIEETNLLEFSGPPSRGQ